MLPHIPLGNSSLKGTTENMIASSSGVKIASKLEAIEIAFLRSACYLAGNLLVLPGEFLPEARPPQYPLVV
jgi:hypothetical protein